jgi:hypothetical protein
MSQTDKQNMLANKLTLIGVAGAQWSDAVYLGTKEVIPGRSTMKAPGSVQDADLEVLAQITTECDSAGDAMTLRVELGYADDDAGTNFVAQRDSTALAQATLVAGYRFPMISGPLPVIPADKYMIARITSAVANPTAGAISIFLVRKNMTQQS